MKCLGSIGIKSKRRVVQGALVVLCAMLAVTACDDRRTNTGLPSNIDSGLSTGSALNTRLDLASEYPAGQELFELANGINEFELVYVDGLYYLFHHDFNELRTYVRRARTLRSLANADDHLVLPGLYPTVIFEHGRWHAWVYDGAHTVHYIAHSWKGPYLKADTVNIFAASDWSVRKNPVDGQYYAAYKDGLSNSAMLERAPSPDGPWSALGPVFPPNKRANWYLAEQADPMVFFYQGKAYMTFSGWGARSFKVSAGEQAIGIVELDPKTFQAKQFATRLIRPTQPWQQRGGGRKIFNPEFLDVPGTCPKIIYAVNPSGPNVRAGWGYIRLNRIVENESKVASMDSGRR